MRVFWTAFDIFVLVILDFLTETALNIFLMKGVYVFTGFVNFDVDTFLTYYLFLKLYFELTYLHIWSGLSKLI